MTTLHDLRAAGARYEAVDGHPPHPDAQYRFAKPGVPQVARRSKTRPSPWDKR